MPKSTVGGGASNQHEVPQHEEQVSVNEDGNPVSVLEQAPIDAGEPEGPQEPQELGEGTEDTETDEQDASAPDVQDTVPDPPQVPQEPVEDDTAKAARLQAELDALKSNQ